MMRPLASFWFLMRNPRAPSVKGKVSPNSGSLWVKSLGAIGVALFVALMLAGIVAFNVPFYFIKQAFNSLDNLDEAQFNSESITKLRTTVKKITDITRKTDPESYERAFVEDIQAAVRKSNVSEAEKKKFASLLDQFSKQPAPKSPVFVSAPSDITALMHPALEKLGFTLSLSSCAECASLTWNEAKGWKLSPPPGTRQADVDEMQWTIVRATVYATGVASQSEKRPIVDVDPTTFTKDAQAILVRAFEVFLHLILVFIAWISLWSAGFVGYFWDRSRRLGTLEPFVSALQPPWVMYGASILRAARGALIVLCVICATAALWGLPLQWKLVGALILFVPVGVCMVGLWGMLATVLFHHERGRMFARLALSPLTMMLALGVRVFIVWMALQSTNPVRANALGIWFLENGHWPILASIPIFLAISAGLFWLINWRIGPRREGLRVCK